MGLGNWCGSWWDQSSDRAVYFLDRNLGLKFVRGRANNIYGETLSRM